MNTESPYVNFFNFIDGQNNEIIDHLNKTIENTNDLYQRYKLQEILIKVYETMCSSNYLIAREQVKYINSISQD